MGRKHYAAIDHAPSEEEALQMGRAIFDSLNGQPGKDATKSEEPTQAQRIAADKLKMIKSEQDQLHGRR